MDNRLSTQWRTSISDTTGSDGSQGMAYAQGNVLFHALVTSCLSVSIAKRLTTTILLSAGEIDCREGIGGPLLEGYNNNVDYQDHVHCTVQEYAKAVSALATQYSLQILVMPVAPHAHRSDRNGKATGRAFRRRVMQAWNDELRNVLSSESRRFLVGL